MSSAHPLTFPSNEATADKTESAGDEEVISAGCCWCVPFVTTVIVTKGEGNVPDRGNIKVERIRVNPQLNHNRREIQKIVTSRDCDLCLCAWCLSS